MRTDSHPLHFESMPASLPTATVFSIGTTSISATATNGNVIDITNNRDTTRSQSFTYDYLNRLTSAQRAAPTSTDIGGHRQGKTRPRRQQEAFRDRK